MTTLSTTTFKGRKFTILKELPVTDLLASEGLVSQQVIEGQRKASYLLQTYQNGVRKTVSPSGRVAYEMPHERD